MNSSPDLIAQSQDSLREAFGKHLTEISSTNKNIVVLDADIAGGTGAHHFQKKFPKRFFQFGIAEQNMISASAGFAAKGLIPFVTGFAVFLLRGFEQARLSIGYTKRNVKIVASHPGLDVGPDGGSAQCLEDLACFRSLPNFVVISPADSIEMKAALKAIIDYEGPVYMRTGRSQSFPIYNKDIDFKIGKGRILKRGNKICIISIGATVHRAIEARDLIKSEFGLDIQVVNMPTLKPIDRKLLKNIFKNFNDVVTTEDHNIFGGLYSAVSEVASSSTHKSIIHPIAVKDTFGESGEPDELAAKYHISTKSIYSTCKKILLKS